MRKHQLAALLCAAALCCTPMGTSLAPITTCAADTDSSSGTCGDNLTWRYDSETKTLTISGEGDMFIENYNGSALHPWNCNHEMEHVVVEEGVTSLGFFAFEYSPHLTSVKLPESLRYINWGAFSTCTALETLEIPSGVTEIEPGAFGNTPWLNNQIAKDPLVVINTILYEGQTAKGDITLPDGITDIAANAFLNNQEITSVTCPDSLKRIGYDSFSQCTALTSVQFNDGLTSVDSSAFSGCSQLAEIRIPDSLTAIAGCAFQDTPWLEARRKEDPLVIVNGTLIDGATCKESDLVLPDTVKALADSAFMNNNDLISVTLPDGIPCIPNSCFSNCGNLTSVNIPDSVTLIDFYAFSSTPLQDEVTVPASVARIQQGAFASTKVKTLTVLNPDCEFDDISDIICTDYTDDGVVFDGTIRGYEGSTAQAYAEKWGYSFEALSSEPPAADLGDLSGDGSVDASDASDLLVLLAEIGAGDLELTPEQQAIADLDKNGTVDAADAAAILQYAAFMGAGGSGSLSDFLASEEFLGH